MRPEWFKCDNCLFLSNRGMIHGMCYLNNATVTVNLESFCEKWTCNNCWDKWNDGTYPDKDREDWYIIYDDHSMCKPAIFNNEP